MTDQDKINELRSHLEKTNGLMVSLWGHVDRLKDEQSIAKDHDELKEQYVSLLTGFSNLMANTAAKKNPQ